MKKKNEEEHKQLQHDKIYNMYDDEMNEDKTKIVSDTRRSPTGVCSV